MTKENARIKRERRGNAMSKKKDDKKDEKKKDKKKGKK